MNSHHWRQGNTFAPGVRDKTGVADCCAVIRHMNSHHLRQGNKIATGIMGETGGAVQSLDT